MLKDHLDSERGNPLPPHGLLFSISSTGFFYMHHPTDRITHTTAFVTPVHGAMGRRIDPSWGGPIELFLVPASAPQLV